MSLIKKDPDCTGLGIRDRPKIFADLGGKLRPGPPAVSSRASATLALIKEKLNQFAVCEVGST